MSTPLFFTHYLTQRFGIMSVQDEELRKINAKPCYERTAAEVIIQRTKGAVSGGCCNRFADNCACDCLTNANRFEAQQAINNDTSSVGKKDTPLDTPITRPAYYGGAEDPYEVIKVLEAWLTPEEFVGWLKGTIIKYMPRAGKKDSGENDVAKAAWYSRYLSEYMKRKK